MIQTQPNIYKERLLQYSKKVSLPGFGGTSLYSVAVFFIHGFTKGSFVTRASSIAFNLSIAIFPSIMFFFSLIPFVIIPDFQNELLSLLKEILPHNAFDFLKSTLIDVLTNKNRGLLSFSLIATIIFASNGVHALISAFNVTMHSIDTRSWVAQRSISLLLVVIVSGLFVVAVVMIASTRSGLNFLIDHDIIRRNITFQIISIGRWIIIVALVLSAISALYCLAPAKRTTTKFVSVGSSLATVLFMIATLGFSSYVNSVGLYNKLYGSIGTIIVLLLWLYVVSIALIIGFELNASIFSVKLNNNESKIVSLNSDTTLSGEATSLDSSTEESL